MIQEKQLTIGKKKKKVDAICSSIKRKLDL